MTHELPTRFGKYVLLDRLAAGGMAEVFLAKVVGVESFERTLAIKCMRPELAENERFTTMFIDEAKLAGRLNHANIVQIYELGRYEDQLYIAMELVEGYDLRRVIERTYTTATRLPEAFAAYVISRAAFALDYAHSRVDSHGNPLNLVHRDISPPNLLISASGEVKVVDFGIAKASARLSETRVGVLKGKLAYMSPEQARGDMVDRRTDIYTLGVVLYEIITGHRLFDGDTDFEILERVKSGSIPDLRNRLPEASPDMISALMKALAPKVKKRFQHAAELGKALEPLLIKDRSIFGATDAAALLTDLFADEFASTAPLNLKAIADVAVGTEEGWREKTQTFHSAFGDDAAADGSAPSSAPTKIGRSGSPGERGALVDELDPNVTATGTGTGTRTGTGAGTGTRAAAPAVALTPTDETHDRSDWRARLEHRMRARAAIQGQAQRAQTEAEGQRRVWWPWLLVMLLCAAGAVFIWFLYGPASPDPQPPVVDQTRPFAPTASHGYLTVKVRGAKNAITNVYVDDQLLGRAPVKGAQVATGTRVIKVQRVEGGPSKVRRVQIKKGHTKRSPFVAVFRL